MTRALAAVAAAVALAGCGGRDELVVAAAASLKGPFESLGGARYSFAGSDELAAQIRQGVRPDVFAAANTSLPEQLHADGLVEEPVVFARNRLVVAVPAGGGIGGLADLGRQGVAIAVGSPSVPVGAYTREVLGRLGAARARAILANVRSEEPDVKGVIGKLTQGAVDAGFVYVTDVEAAGGALRAIELPAAIDPGVRYAAAVVAGADHPGEARAFVASLTRGEGRAQLARAGFTVP